MSGASECYYKAAPYITHTRPPTYWVETSRARAMVETADVLKYTFAVSILVQVVALGLTIAAIAKDGASEILILILAAELGTSGVQLVWYLSVVFFYYVRKIEGAMTISLRYFDCPPSVAPLPLPCPPLTTARRCAGFITTPLMILTLNLLFLYWKRSCTTIDEAFSGSFIAGNVVALIADWIMLLIGLLVETEKIEPEYELVILQYGYIPLLIAFIPSTVILANHYTTHGLVVLIATICVWALYGHASISYHDMRDKKAAAFNVLDVISKNIFAIVVSAIVLNEDLNCP